MSEKEIKKNSAIRERLFEIIFEADTPLGKAFDVALLIFIIASVFVVIIETLAGWSPFMISFFHAAEWVFTIFFTIEYILRLYVVLKPIKYATSFYGIIDLLAIIPTYIGLFFPHVVALMSFRALRLLRVFRIFKLGKFLKESQVIVKALQNSRQKIGVFLTFVILMVIIIGSLMYVVEGGIGENDRFSSIPTSIYWAIVTLTTVGYGDIVPTTPTGQFISAIVMILGYAVIAVPTGIVSAEIVEGVKKSKENRETKLHEETWLNTQMCQSCGDDRHSDDAFYCKTCGHPLNLHVAE